MQRFLYNFFLFITPLLIAAYPIDYFLSLNLQKNNKYPGELEVWNDIYHHSASCDIAIYGSSRAWVHINPKTIADSTGKSAYNFGIDGHNFWLQYLRHEELNKNNKPPKIIIHSVDEFTLEKRPDLYCPEQFLPYMSRNSNIEKYTSSYLGYRKIDYKLPLIRYFGKKKEIRFCLDVFFNENNLPNYRYRGFREMDRIWSSDLENAKTKMAYYEAKLDKRTIELFEGFIKECKTNQINLIFVFTPEHIDGQKYVSNRREIQKIYTEFSKKYDIPYLDYSNDTLCLNKKYFYNASHLNASGADIFSKKLAHDLKTLNLLK